MVKDGEDLHGLQNNKIEKFRLNFSNSLTMSPFCISYIHVPQHSITNYLNTISTKTNLERGNRSILCTNAKTMITVTFGTFVTKMHLKATSVPGRVFQVNC